MAKKPKAVVLGVGALRGIGGAASRRFAKEGYHVLVAGRTPQKIEAVVDAIRKDGGAAHHAVHLVPLPLADQRPHVRRGIGRSNCIDVFDEVAERCAVFANRRLERDRFLRDGLNLTDAVDGEIELSC